MRHIHSRFVACRCPFTPVIISAEKACSTDASDSPPELFTPIGSDTGYFDVMAKDIRELRESPLTWYSAKEQETYSVPLDVALNLICDADPKVQSNGIRALRGKDSDYHPTQGYIVLDHVKKTQDAARQMLHELSDCKAVFGLDRGGGLLISYLEALSPRDTSQEFHRIPKVAVRKDHMAALKERILKVVASIDPDSSGPVILGFVETFISGTSVNMLINELKQLQPSLPTYVMLKVVAMRQTLGGPDVKVLSPKTIPLIKIDAPYLPGEDVDYQLSETHPHRQSPVIIVNTSPEGHPISAFSITPRGHLNARDVIVSLVQGLFNESLGIAAAGATL